MWIDLIDQLFPCSLLHVVNIKQNMLEVIEVSWKYEVDSHKKRCDKVEDILDP